MNLQRLLENFNETVTGSIQQMAPDGMIRRQDVGLILVSTAVSIAAALGCTREQLEENWLVVLELLKGNQAPAEARRSVMHAVDGEGLRSGPASKASANARRQGFQLLDAAGNPLTEDDKEGA